MRKDKPARRVKAARARPAKRLDVTRLQAALESAQERLQAVVSNAPIVLFALDREGIFALSEGRGLQALGLKPGEVVGRSVFDVYRDHPQILANARRALAGEAFASTVEVAGIVFETRYVPSRDRAGRPSGAVGVAVDVTEQKIADRLLHQQAAAMRASMDGTAVLNEREEYIYLNDAHARVYGYDRPEDLLGKTWRLLYAPDELKRFETQIMPALRREGRWRGEAVGRRRDGGLFPQEVSLTLIEGGGLVCVVRDITERRRAESEHLRLFELEKSARTEAEAASRAKDEFLAVVSHELRTPMTAVLGWMWLLRAGDVSSADRERALEVIERNMKLQAQIIEDLLDVSSIVTGKLQLDSRPVDLRLVLHDSIDTVRSTAQAKSVRLDADMTEEATILGDPYRLQQVFWNLLSNAIKFNRESGRVRVRLVKDGRRARVAVEDDGQGIEADFLPNVFDPFRQGENSLTRKHRGLGIGLAIVKHLIELHGGAVRADSPGPGRGATFSVELPLCDVPPRAPGSSGRGGGGSLPISLTHTLDNLRVLLVDDETDTLAMLAELLKHCGAEVDTAPSAPAALEALGRHPPDIVVADIAMPGEDGYSLIRRIRARGVKGGGSVRAVALTAHAKSEDRALALEAGYEMFLAKPVAPSDLVSALRQLAGRSRIPSL